jgi:hypothetical protein
MFAHLHHTMLCSKRKEKKRNFHPTSGKTTQNSSNARTPKKQTPKTPKKTNPEKTSSQEKQHKIKLLLSSPDPPTSFYPADSCPGKDPRA